MQKKGKPYPGARLGNIYRICLIDNLQEIIGSAGIIIESENDNFYIDAHFDNGAIQSFAKNDFYSDVLSTLTQLKKS